MLKKQYGIKPSGSFPINKEFEELYGGMWGTEPDPIKHAHLRIAHIDKKRKALGIDKARDRVMMNFAARQAL